jgi:hypothetical protein
MVDKRKQEVLGARAALVVLVDLALRRHDPKGPGRPCWDKLSWIREMLEARLDAFKRRRLELPAPVVADSWFGDLKSMMHVGLKHQGTLVVEGKAPMSLR